MSTLEDQRREMSQTLKNLQDGAAENGGQIRNLTAAVDDIKSGLQKMEAATLEFNKRAYQPSGSDAELRRYTHANAADLASNKRNYAQNGDSVVRLRGHVSKAGGYVPGLLDDTNARTQWQRELQEVVTTRSIVRMVRRNRDGSCIGSPIMDAAVADMLRAGPQGISRIFADGSGAGIQGEDLIPDQAIPELERAVQFASGIADIFDTKDVPPGGLFRLPFTGGNLFPTIKTAPTGNDPANAPLSEWNSSNNTVEAIPLVVSTQLDREAAEESIIAVVPEVMAAMARGWQFGKDNIALNGRTDGSQDDLPNWDVRGIWTDNSALFASTAHHLRMADGLRRDAIATSSAIDGNAAQTADGVRTLLKTLGARFFSNLSDVVILMSPEYLLGTALGFTEIKTWDSVGADASILTGQLPGGAGGLPGQIGFLWGVPVCVTPFLTADLNATGVFDNVTETQTGMLVVSRSKYEWRMRKAMMVETDVEVRNDTVTLVGRMKTVFRKVGNTADKSCAYAYNLDA
jgi:hypothetical protein